MPYAKITVIVPVYNTELYLSKCIDSIVNQTYQNIQIILIDDGSTDASGEICEQYAMRDDRIEVYHTENRGLVSARKLGLKHSKGDYIGFVDSDDYIEKNLYETMLKIITENNADFVHMGYLREENGDIKEITGFEEGIFELKSIKEREEFLIKYIFELDANHTISFSIWSKLYKSQLIKECYSMLQDNYEYGEDLFNLCLCILQSERISLNRYVLYHYVVKDNSMSHFQNMNYIVKELELCENVVKNICNYSEQIYRDLEQPICNYVVKRISTLIERINNKIRINRFCFKNIDILKGKKIAIWGAGAVGKDYYAQFCKYRSIEIVAWFDLNWKQIHCDYDKITGIESIDNYKFEKIVIAVNEEKIAKEIKKSLLECGQPEEKIIWSKPENILNS